MIRTLARPNLVAMSGEKASFLAGGEFPFPVPSGVNLITIEFRQYGVKLDFTPTVQEDGKIKLVVAPEVSALDPTNTVRVDNVTIPALTVRRTNTTVELRDGDSLAIGGLFQHSAQTDVNQIPGLGSIPILSSLFRSTRYQRNETELLIIVTPHIINQGDIEKAKTQTLSGSEPGDVDLILNGKALDKPMTRDLRGPIEPPPAPAAQALRGEIKAAPPTVAPIAPAAVVSAAVPATAIPTATASSTAPAIATPNVNTLAAIVQTVPQTVPVATAAGK
jgi:pilus assembly protein CpaC